MKKEIPQPLVIGSIALALLATVFLLWRGIQGPPELPRAPIKVGKEAVPDYMKDKMSPQMQRMVEEQSKKFGTPADADSTSSQPVPNR